MATRRQTAAGLCLAWLGLVVACAQTKAAPEGGDCFAATDCDVGLICAVTQDGRRACTKDLSGTTKVPGSSSGGMDATAAADGARPDANAGTDAQQPVQDAGVDAPVIVPDAGPDATADASSDAAGD